MKLLPMKHLLVTRDRKIYWYIGDVLNTKNNLIGCGTSTNVNIKNIWDDKLLGLRDKNKNTYIFGEPRGYDVIYIYEILDMEKWLDIFHKIKYVELIHLDGYTKEYTKLVYERIDGELE